MALRPRRLSGAPPRALAAALVVLGLTAVAALGAQHASDERARSIERTRDASQVVRLEFALSAGLASTRSVAIEAVYGAFVNAATRVVRDDTGTSFVLTHGSAIERIITRNERTDALSAAAGSSEVRAARQTAIADGNAHVVAPVMLDGAPAVVYVVPGYLSTAATDLATRRAANPAVVLGIVRFGTLRNPPDVPSLWPGSPVDITTPQGSIGARVRHPVLSSELRAGNAVWRVSIGRSSADRPISGFVILLAGAMLAGLVLVMMRRRQRERDRAAHEIDVRTRQLQLIATTSATLQQSLDLAELLPLFTVDIADEFDLACVAVHITDEQGAFLEIFRHGRVPSSDPGLVVDLRRGWRTVGRLLVHPRRPLDDVSVQSLQAAADLLAIAVTNSQLYEREQQAVSRLNELDALKNAFLSTVSHELRTATTAVQGFADLLTEHWDVTPDDRRREMASRIHRQSGSLRHLVDDLLDYARLDAERLRVTPRDVVLTEIVEHLAETFSSLVATHRLVVDAEPGLHAWVDPIAVERILANLLSNAGKYAPADTTVTVTLVRHGDRARLSVADQGPGIPEAERRRVFVRFYRLDNAQTIRTHGAGIGLAILQDFADRSGADVTIEDAPGGGALVHVDFPTAPTTARPGESA